MNEASLTNPFHFSLAPNVYAASFDNSVIILDGRSDKYLSLVDDAAHFFCSILKNKFIKKNDNQYYLFLSETEDENNTYHQWISYFIEKKLIVPGIRATYVSTPIQPGGLIEYRWDSKKLWKSFSESSFFEIAKALYMLSKVHRTIKRKGIAGVITLIKNSASIANQHIPSAQETQKLAAHIDAASLLYPKKTLCLAWATTYVALALRKNWKINLVIGVQTNPFYAHAWAETETGEVINDDPAIARVLAIIFKEPHQ